MPDEEVARRVEAMLDPESEERGKRLWMSLVLGERIDEAFVEKLLAENDDA